MNWIVEAETLEDMLNDNYSIAIELTRCKDCKHYLRPHGCWHIDGMATAQEDGFCSYAERWEK